MLIVSASANGANAGLGRITRTIYGMPATDLSGLWLFNDGDIGDAIISVTDRSGNGRHANLIDGWQAGHKSAGGMIVDNIDGAKFQTGLPINPAGGAQTVFVAGTTLLPGSEPVIYSTWLGSTINNPTAGPEGLKTNGPALSMTSNGSTAVGTTIVFDNESDLLGVGSIVMSYPPLGEPGIFAMDIDAANNTVKLHARGRSTVSVTNASIGAYYDGVTDLGRLTIGAWAHGYARTAGGALGDLYAVAAFDRTFSESAAQRYMQYMYDALSDRGLSFA